MQPDDVFRTTTGLGDVVHVQAGGIRGQYCARLRDFAQALEDGFLYVHAFENGLDDQVAVAERVVVDRCRQQHLQAFRLVLGQEAFLDAGRQVLADGFYATGQCLFRLVDQHRRHGRAQKADSDARAHQAGADNADFPDRASWRAGSDAGHIRELSHRHADVLFRVHRGHVLPSSSADYCSVTKIIAVRFTRPMPIVDGNMPTGHGAML